MLVIAGAFIVAGIAKGAIGMGMPPIAIGLMSFAVPLESAISIMVVPTMAGVWLGQKARRRLSPETFRRIFILGMLAVGLHLATSLL